MGKRNRIIAIGLIGIGLMMLFGKWMSFLTIVALLLLLLGVYRIHNGDIKKGYIFLGIGAGLILLDHLILIVAICLISLGLFYGKSKKIQTKENFLQKTSFMSNFDLDQSPWVMRSMSVWHVLGESDLDISLAMPEEKETVIMFQGVMGDIDLDIPDYYGVEIEAFVVFGSINFDGKKDSGMMNRFSWKSTNYIDSDYKVKFIVSYIVGDLDIRLT
ncbi:cell wall-active antibiotics response protein LiaF [Paenibacillus sp. FA6]|uniref:cell wall-active antibiotics response protein LiaF n=1 Tax=Paenibacillus sp. FA6 TaxID=3413029 RepID=UPI003F65E0C2